MRQISRAVIGLLFFSVLGCSSLDPLDRLATGGLQRGAISAGEFSLATLGLPIPERAEQVRVYIGSDGRPWTGNRPAADPTGNRSLAAEMMLADPLPALYLGRPCYHGGAERPPCAARLWTSGRYSDTVVNALVTALEQIIQRYQPHRLSLVGYSGGGTLAVLVASRLPAGPQLEVITVAANLDPQAWTSFHNLLPLSDSLNPADAVPAPAAFRQIHLVGSEDELVPRQTIGRYIERQPQAQVLEVEGFGHVCCWVEHWPQLLADIAAR